MLAACRHGMYVRLLALGETKFMFTKPQEMPNLIKWRQSTFGRRLVVGGAVLSLLKFGSGRVLRAPCAQVPGATGSPVAVDWGWADSRWPRGVTKTPHRRHLRPRTAYADGSAQGGLR